MRVSERTKSNVKIEGRPVGAPKSESIKSVRKIREYRGREQARSLLSWYFVDNFQISGRISRDKKPIVS